MIEYEVKALANYKKKETPIPIKKVVEKPLQIPKIKIPECLKKHIKRDGKK